MLYQQVGAFCVVFCRIRHRKSIVYKPTVKSYETTLFCCLFLEGLGWNGDISALHFGCAFHSSCFRKKKAIHI